MRIADIISKDGYTQPLLGQKIVALSKYNRWRLAMEKFYISVGTSKKCTIWENKETTWEEFKNRFVEPTRTPETTKEYLAMIPAQQGVIKDVGGFVGGYLINGKRKSNTVKNRSLICLDLDDPIMGIVPDIKYRGIMHSTHKHTAGQPRYRLIIALKENLSSEEYEYVSRHISKEIGTFYEYADSTTYQPNRLMFWPSCPKDGEYIFKEFEGEEVDGKKILEDNPAWQSEIFKDIPIKDIANIKRLVGKKQADPTEKNGVIGAFCKTYTMTECIETFISDKYTATDLPDRYTYTEGSTQGGVIIYEDKYSYSFHNTDPASMRLCNAYDLVRLLNFKGNEKEALTFCAAQKGVAVYLAQEEFGEEFQEWQKQLEYMKNGQVKATMANLELILDNTYKLQFDEFKQQSIIDDRPYKNSDDSILLSNIENKYNIYNETKLKRSVEVVCHKNSFHPVKDYLEGLEWDGKPRIDTLLVDYFHAEDNAFTREAIRNTLLSGIRRIYEPGCEVQHILVLRSEENIGKSTFFKMLCPDTRWFNESLSLLDCTKGAKTSGEHLLGHWILEIPEVAGIRKSEVEAVKSFLSRDIDNFRQAYARMSEQYPRQCIFFASTNATYLQGTTGNRRFWTIKCPGRFKDTLNRDQIWAEAKHIYMSWANKSLDEIRSILKLSDEAYKLSKIAENENIETDDRTVFIQDYIDRKIPIDWRDKSISERIQFLNDDLSPVDGEGLVEREWVTVAEIWCELYQKPKSELKRANSIDIIKSLISLGYTHKIENCRDKKYGKARGYKKPSN
jgi:putative DNA primase/helicase